MYKTKVVNSEVQFILGQYHDYTNQWSESGNNKFLSNIILRSDPIFLLVNTNSSLSEIQISLYQSLFVYVTLFLVPFIGILEPGIPPRKNASRKARGSAARAAEIRVYKIMEKKFGNSYGNIIVGSHFVLRENIMQEYFVD